jgi:phage terminase large subunit GpA-like protein
MVHVVAAKRKVPLAKWIEQTIRLPIGLSAEPGPIKLAPYMRAIADAIGDPKVERVTCIKSARIGWTTMLAGAVAHYMTRDPCRILALWPTESDARGWLISDLEPIFLDSPALRDVLPVPRPGRLDHVTLLHRIGERGAMLTAVGAGAPRNLRRHSAKVLMVDEADACETLSEGNPIALAVQRTLSFPDRKILVGSTPLDEATSHIARLYQQSDQRIFEVPCQCCGAFAEIAWRDIEWPPDRPQDAAWRCPHCRELVAEKHKAGMVRRGRRRAQRPEAGPTTGAIG